MPPLSVAEPPLPCESRAGIGTFQHQYLSGPEHPMRQRPSFLTIGVVMAASGKMFELRTEFAGVSNWRNGLGQATFQTRIAGPPWRHN
jgi:hypothetical protein